MNARAELDAYFERVPEHVLTVLDQAYFEYVDGRDYPDGIEEYLKRDGRRVLVPADVLEDLRARRAAGRLRGRPGRRSSARSARCATPFDLNEMSPGGRAREPRRRRGDRAPPRDATAEGRDAAARRSAPSCPCASRARGRELPLRRHRRRRRAALRRAAARGRDRPAAGAVRRADRDPRHRRDSRGERASSPRRSRACSRRPS